MRPPSPRRLTGAASLAVTLLVLSVSMALLPGGTALAHGDDDDHELPAGWILYDGGSLLEPSQFVGGAIPLELAIDFFAPGLPAVRWNNTATPVVPMCTRQANRPAWVSAEDFRESVRRGVQAWSEAEAAVGFNYTGDCTQGSTWALENGINEIGWDDQRNLVKGNAAGVTFGSWSPSNRRFVETDIILHRQLNVPMACLDSVIAHELGHALGFGHSTTPGHLMYASFNPNDVSTCPPGPVAAEVAVLQQLYGTNRLPVVAAPMTQTIAAGASVTLSVSASDPDGDPLTYTWTQVAGPSVAFTVSTSSITFVAPSQAGQTLQFRVTVRDPYLHAATATVTARVVDLGTAPVFPPELDTFRLSEDGRRMALVYSEVALATEYRVCTRPEGSSVQSCSTQATPVVEVTWDTVMGATVQNEPRRTFSGGFREVVIQACNVRGCSRASTGTVKAGGLRWTGHQIDFDYFAFSFEIPRSTHKYSIVAVQNVSSTPRSFLFHAGVLGDLQRQRILDCGNVLPGDLCIGFLGPETQNHGTHVSITSRRPGTAETFHPIQIR